MKFLHTADWQIGMKALHLGAAGQRVREERLAAARRVVALANDRDAEFMLVAGDTFEDNGVERILIQKTADILREFKGPVYIIPGNHDPLVPGSVWEHPSWASTANLHILKEPEPVEVPGGLLFPCPIMEKHSNANPAGWINAGGKKEICIGLAHGTVEGLPLDDPDFPIPRNAPAAGGLDYLALGHWHSTAPYKDNQGKETMAYAGTHETTRSGERDSGNALLVEITGRGAAPRLEILHTGGLQWLPLIERNLDNPDSLDRVKKEIELLEACDTSIIQVKLSGFLYEGHQEKIDHLADILKSRFLHHQLDISGLTPTPDDDRWISSLPEGVIQKTARTLAEEWKSGGETSGVAREAIMQLFRLSREVQT